MEAQNRAVFAIIRAARQNSAREAYIVELREKLEKLRRNGITLDISGSAEYKRGGTRFGGRPDVPRGFEWPVYEGEGMHGKTAKRPLSFVAQFDCAELAKHDAERLLPDHGVLSFFYEMDTMRWGYDPKDKSCARVYWFEDSAALEAAEFPDDLAEDYRFPALAVKMRAEPSLPGWEDFTEIYPEEADSATRETSSSRCARSSETTTPTNARSCSAGPTRYRGACRRNASS